MKTITFFSEKGGVGKSSFAIMYASFLKYKNGVKVGVADFNQRLMMYRHDEITAIQKNNAAIVDKIAEMKEANPDFNGSKLMEDYFTINKEQSWPILGCDMMYAKQQNDIKNHGYSMWLRNTIYEGDFKDMDVVICDFPGSLTGYEYPQILADGLLSLTVIPSEQESQALRSTIKIHKMTEKIGKNHLTFINKADLRIKKTQHAAFQKSLQNQGLKVLPDMLSLCDKMKSIDKYDIMRSTFRWPNWDAKAFEGTKDIGLTNLFIDITRELDKCPDIPGTKEADLSFVNSITKTEDDRRQLSGTAFPEYEII